MLKSTLMAATLAITASVAFAETPCPPALAEAPALSATGPYLQIEKEGEITVAYLPNCATVEWQRQTIGPGKGVVRAEENGTYTLKVEISD